MIDRTLTCFFAKELMINSFEGILDSKRKQLLDSHLKECESCKQAYNKLKKSQTVLAELSKTRCHNEVVELLKKEDHIWRELVKKYGWSQWNTNLKWAAELCVVAIVLAVTVHIFPWLNLARTIKHWQPFRSQKLETIANQTPAPQPPPPELPSSIQTGTDVEPEATVPKVATFTPPPKPHAVAKATPKPLSVREQEERESITESYSVKSTEKEAGLVWRGELIVTEATDEIIHRVVTAITNLGGTKAGKVDLGWRRNNEPPYYHFIIPVTNYDKLLNDLNAEGYVTLKKEKHPRVIKEGYMRIIMTIEEEK